MNDLLISGINHFTGWLDFLEPYGDVISPVISKIGGISSFVFKIFDAINFIIPVDTIFHCLGIMVAFYVISFIVWLVLWLIRRVADIIP